MSRWAPPEGGLPVPDPPLSAGPAMLRPWVPGDAPALAAGWGDDEVTRWTNVPGDRSEASALSWIGGQDERRRRILAVDLAVTVDHLAVGEVGLSSFSSERSAALIGWWIAASARGRGLAAAAVDAVAAWALTVLDLEVVVAEVASGNEASIRVARRAGFSPLEHPGAGFSGRTVWVRRNAPQG